METGLRSFTEEQKRLIGISTISVVTRLALEFKVDEVRFVLLHKCYPTSDRNQVTRLTISMLLQRLRTAEPTVEAAIAYNLVDLALEAPEGSFIDIIRRFSAINRSANPDDPRFSNNMVFFLLRVLFLSITSTACVGLGGANKASPGSETERGIEGNLSRRTSYFVCRQRRCNTKSGHRKSRR